MPYTLWSRGRLIGHTDLDCVRVLPTTRMGWFHPTPVGEKVMPIAVAVPPVIQAYVERARQLDGDSTAVQSQLDRSTEGADLSAAFNHLEALEFELRREDGLVVQTDSIGFQDTHRLLARAHEWEAEDIDGWTDVGDMLLEPSEDDLEIERAMEHDVALVREWFSQRDGLREWAVGEIDDSFPRYQVYVELVDGASIP